MSTIGVIGAGHIGRNFSLAAIAIGHDIVIANSQGPETLTDLVAELGPKARAATVDEAASSGAFALIAIPLGGLENIPVEPLAGRIVLTTTNYFPKRDGQHEDIDSGRLTVPGLFHAHLPSSRVARAFNHLNAADIASAGSPEGTPNRRALAYTADEPEVGDLVAELYNALGFDAVDAGGNDAAWRLDVDQPTFVVRMNAEELRANLAAAHPPTTTA